LPHLKTGQLELHDKTSTMSLPLFTIRPLGPVDVPLLRNLNALFGEAFADAKTYAVDLPSDDYVKKLLAKEHVIALVATSDEEAVGGLVAYELDKFERIRRELYIYDLAVAAKHRRKGIATALIKRFREIAVRRGAWVIYVQADYEDPPAIALYDKLGSGKRCCTSTSELSKDNDLWLRVRIGYGDADWLKREFGLSFATGIPGRESADAGCRR
jgi:aminoglycoside 3-N-acetyltransferase I